MNQPSFHVAVPAWALFLVMLLDVGLVTFGDPAAFGAAPMATPLFKAVVAMIGVALAVMVATPAAPAEPAPPAKAPEPVAQPI